jgi:hypothetical protein
VLNAVILSVIMLVFITKCHFTEWRSAERHCAERRYTAQDVVILGSIC